LQRATKTPVRSFEHASNAFARLFKSESSSPERSRSSSLKSELGHKRSGSGKTDHGIVWGGRAPQSPRRVLRKKSIDSSMHDTKQENGVPVAADAPPVPVLPPKSPSKSIRSLKKQRQQQLTTTRLNDQHPLPCHPPVWEPAPCHLDQNTRRLLGVSHNVRAVALHPSQLHPILHTSPYSNAPFRASRFYWHASSTSHRHSQLSTSDSTASRT
jgi:hypothetical protein